jgi:AbrB family looped-hinge helix DNA binding protein
MQITVDKAGRLVVPRTLRDRYNMHEGTVLDVEPEADGIRLRVAGQHPSLVREQGVLVHHGPSTVQIDVAKFVNRARETRDRASGTPDRLE